MSIHIIVHEKLYTDIDLLIKDYIPFIIQTISSITHRYISIENDDEFSIGLMAFYEAVCKYNEERGDFLPFAKLVIKSRLLNYLNSENKHSALQSLDALSKEIDLDSLKFQYLDTPLDKSNVLQEEIHFLNKLLKDFKFDLASLSNEAPKHQKTRENAISISEKISKDKPLLDWMYLKRRLPITQIALKYQITQKILKGSKNFIITVTIIFDKNLHNLKLWIRK